MTRRNLAVLALALASFAITACSNITGPQANGGTSKTSTATATTTDSPCQVTMGSSTC